MNPQPPEPTPSGGARSKLLNAAISIIRKKGYAATSVDELCASAGVTKGAFFHHFPSKDSLAVAATNHWSELSDALFAAAPYHRLDDPLDRILGYLDFRKALLRGEVAEFTCLAGTMLQEAYATHPGIRRACDASIGGHAAKVEADIADAMKLYHLGAPWTAESLALHTQAVLQGAFILAKPRAAPQWSRRASTTCVAISNCCSVVRGKGLTARPDDPENRSLAQVPHLDAETGPSKAAY